MIVLSVTSAACGEATSQPAQLPTTDAGSATRAPLRSNQRVLTRAASQRLIEWAERFRRCAETDGIAMAALRAERRQIVLTTRRKWPLAQLAMKSIRCGESLGEPPKGSSLQVSKDGAGFVLYLPIQCLLDEKVRSETATDFATASIASPIRAYGTRWS
jgi:hypothetical protein